MREISSGRTNRIAIHERENIEAVSPLPFSIGIYTSHRTVSPVMAKTTDDLLNEIRAVEHHERIESTAFTKEALAAICDAVGYDIDDTILPPKAQMRAGILWTLDVVDDDDPENGTRPFRKSELQSIAAALDAS